MHTKKEEKDSIIPFTHVKELSIIPLCPNVLCIHILTEYVVTKKSNQQIQRVIQTWYDLKEKFQEDHG